MDNHRFSTWCAEMKCSYPWLVFFFMAYVSSFILSGVSAPQPDLDESYQVVLEYARAHNFQFGNDIVFTFGPLGFLNTQVSQGLFPIQRILFALTWSGIVAWSATGLARQIPGRIKFVFLVWFLIYSNLGWLEQHAFLVMLYGCMILMGDVQRRKAAAISFLSVFAILALIKFTFFIAATFGVILCILVQICRRNFKTSLFIALFYISTFIVLWLADGQKIENLLPWMRGSFEIAAGYTEAMTIFPKVRVLTICAVAGVMFLASLWLVIRTVRMNFSSLGILLVTTAYVFISWKHGFVRADGHVLFFVFFLPIASAILLTETFRKGTNKKYQLCLATLFTGVVILCNWAADIQEPGTMLTKLINWPQHMVGNSRLMLNSVTGNWDKCFETLQANQPQRPVPDLPVVRAVVGSGSIDVVNYRQSAALVNNLNYRPCPVIQGYSAYTPYLQDMNLSFYRSGKRPQYLLFKMETIDNRFPALDDATLLPYILSNYKPVAKDGEFLVLQVLQNIPIDGGIALVHEQTVAFEEYLDLSAYNNSLLIMQVDVKPTFLGGVTKFLFQSPVLTLNARMNGKTINYRFIPAMAERGFVVSPVLHTNNDVMDYFDGAAVNRADSISFSKPEYAFGQISDAITIRLYKVNIL